MQRSLAGNLDIFLKVYNCMSVFFGMWPCYFMYFLFVANVHLHAGVQAVLNSFYGKPDRTLHLSTVACTGSENKLVECSFQLLPLEDGKSIVKNVDVAGVSCKKQASKSLLISSSNSLLTSTNTLIISSPTSSPDVAERLISHTTFYTILGVLGSTTLIGIIIIIM